MACPLSALLNPRDISPIRIIDKRTEELADDDRHISNNLIDYPADHPSIPCLPATPRSATRPVINEYDYKYPVVLSNKKGHLYCRRAARFAHRRHDLPTPPSSSSSPSLPDSQSFSQYTCRSSSQSPQDLSFISASGDHLTTTTTTTTTHDHHHLLLRPPTPEVYFREFSIFQALHAHPELIFELTQHFDIDDLISLYAISVDFHKLVNARFTTMIRNQAEVRAPESAQVFVFRCYRDLCIRDPVMRPLARIPYQARWVPSFRWLRMIVYREHIVDEIITCLENEGLFLPPSASLTLKKIWFTLDISDTERRVSLMHNKQFWSDEDLRIATIFFVKLDMRLTDPRTGNGELGLRKMLLVQPGGLAALLRALQRQILRSPLEMIRLFVRWRYRPRPRVAHLSILGIPTDQIGTLQYEGWGTRPRRLIDVDDLIVGEGVRRKLLLETGLIEMILDGFVDKRTFLDRWHPGAVMDEEVGLLERNLLNDGDGGSGGISGGSDASGTGTGTGIAGGDADNEPLPPSSSSSFSSPSSASASASASSSSSSSSPSSASPHLITTALAPAPAPAPTPTNSAIAIAMDMVMDTDTDTGTETDMDVDVDVDLDMEIDM